MCPKDLLVLLLRTSRTELLRVAFAPTPAERKSLGRQVARHRRQATVYDSASLRSLVGARHRARLCTLVLSDIAAATLGTTLGATTITTTTIASTALASALSAASSAPTPTASTIAPTLPLPLPLQLLWG
jgi:hypothetical protein